MSSASSEATRRDSIVQLGGEQGRGPQSHELAEDMAEWQRVQDANGVKGLLELEILLHLLLDGSKAREHVAMGVDDAFGIAGGAGGEDDLQRVVGHQVVDGDGLLRGEGGGEVFEGRRGVLELEKREFGGVADETFGRYFALDARATKSSEPAKSTGTGTTPRSRQPKKAATHSGPFSPQSRTRSPLTMERRASSAAKRRASVASWEYVTRRWRTPRGATMARSRG